MGLHFAVYSMMNAVNLLLGREGTTRHRRLVDVFTAQWVIAAGLMHGFRYFLMYNLGKRTWY